MIGIFVTILGLLVVGYSQFVENSDDSESGKLILLVGIILLLGN